MQDLPVASGARKAPVNSAVGSSYADHAEHVDHRAGGYAVYRPQVLVACLPPEVVLDPGLSVMLLNSDLQVKNIMIEIAESIRIDGYGQVEATLQVLRETGASLAVDAPERAMPPSAACYDYGRTTSSSTGRSPQAATPTRPGAR